jgi:hypothetical protein
LSVPNRLCFTGHTQTNNYNELKSLRGLLTEALCAAEARTSCDRSSFIVITSAQLTMKPTLQFLSDDQALDSYRSPHVRSLCGRNLPGNTLRGWFSNYVEQNFAYLARACANRVPLLILQSIDLPVWVEGKDHWFSVH